MHPGFDVEGYVEAVVERARSLLRDPATPVKLRAETVDLLDRGFVLSGHSTSLVHRSVSAINPPIAHPFL